MPRRSILSDADKRKLLAMPDDQTDIIRYYTLNDSDLSVIKQHRGFANRLGFAVQLCYLRFPGISIGVNEQPFVPLLNLVAEQLSIPAKNWRKYGQRKQTRREHLLELQKWLGMSIFSSSEHHYLVRQLAKLAQQTDRGIVLAEMLIELMRQQHIILPSIEVIERLCGEALSLGLQQVYNILSTKLTTYNCHVLDDLLIIKQNIKNSTITWLRQPPGPPKPKHILTHINRLLTIQDLLLPEGINTAVHQNRLTKLAREGAQMTAQHLRDLEPTRRYATLVALIFDTQATLIDEIINLHDRFVGSLFNKAKRKHAEHFETIKITV